MQRLPSPMAVPYPHSQAPVISESHSDRCFLVEQLTETRPHLRAFLFAVADYARGLEEAAETLTRDALALGSDRLLVRAGEFAKRLAKAEELLRVLD